nr:hypothetical protein [Oceanibaculum indicum]
MPRLAQGHGPFGTLQISRIEQPGEDAVDVLVRHRAVAGLGEFGEALEIALYLGLRLEPATGIEFHRLRDDRGQRLVPHQHLALAGAGLIAVSGRATERPVAVQQPRAHAVGGLLGVLLALVLGDGGKKVLDEDGIGILAELDGGAFEPRPCLSDGLAQIEMPPDRAGKAADIVDQDNMLPVPPMFLQIGQHGQHAGAVDHAAGNGFVFETGRDLISLHSREFLAAGALRGVSLSLGDLRGGRDAAIDDGYPLFQIILHS